MGRICDGAKRGAGGWGVGTNIYMMHCEGGWRFWVLTTTETTGTTGTPQHSVCFGIARGGYGLWVMGYGLWGVGYGVCRLGACVRFGSLRSRRGKGAKNGVASGGVRGMGSGEGWKKVFCRFLSLCLLRSGARFFFFFCRYIRDFAYICTRFFET